MASNAPKRSGSMSGSRGLVPPGEMPNASGETCRLAAEQKSGACVKRQDRVHAYA